ncbi:class II fumarate hydratase [Thermodesulfobacteriota bacterium]
METREEKDAMGAVRVPADAYFGASTQRARDNFEDSGLKLPKDFIHALALIKKCAARANQDLELLSGDLAEPIADAAQEVIDGRFDGQFVVDLFQTGSGTSTNMNMNEVLAARANEIITGTRGGKSPVHPNDHVNLGQSSNDVIPTTMHLAALLGAQKRLLPALRSLQTALTDKATEFQSIRKIGRTHLQDAVPIFLGQEFGGYARQVDLGLERVTHALGSLRELALGGTAVGNGLNTHPDFAQQVIDRLNKITGSEVREAADHFEAQGAQDAAVEMSGVLKTVAVSLTKIANDLRWLGSGPRCGLGEIKLPALQPGSSIMPGKVNPVIPEAVLQIAAQVIGNDTTIAVAGQAGVLELNVMLPVITYNLLQSIDLLAHAADLLTRKCVTGIEADRAQCAAGLEKSLALATYLVPHLGYDKAAALAYKAYKSGKSIREAALTEKLMPAETLAKLLPG